MINSIPSEEDFARASAEMAENDRGLSQVRELLVDHFSDCGVYDSFIFYSSNTSSFYAYIFYSWDKQIEEAEQSGLSQEIRDVVYETLENIGRGKRNKIQVDFEFDSHEAVERDYGGDYFDRLR